MITLLKQFPLRWNEFWFESNEAYQFDIFRRLLAFVLFSCYAVRTLDLKLFYSDQGIMPISKVADSIFMEGRYSLLFLFPSDAAMWFFHLLFLACLACMIFKILPRLTTILAFILHVSFMHRTLIISYGVDLISVFFLFYLCFADLRATAIAGDPKLRTGQDWRSSMGSVAYRMSQLQLCIIYAFGGCEKLKGMQWWHGDSVWTMMANVQIARGGMSWFVTFLSHYPSLIVIMTFATLVWEIYFPVLIWVKQLRPYVLLFGLIMHLVIMVTVDIPYFSLLMMCIYILFLEREPLEAFIKNTLNKCTI